MEWLSLLFAAIAAIASVYAIVVSKRSSKDTTAQLDDMQKGVNDIQKGVNNIKTDIENLHKDWDTKRKFSRDYDAFLEFQHNTRR